jgi:radical SAM superfamily enzyme YgiQ (UPF0313 family)
VCHRREAPIDEVRGIVFMRDGQLVKTLPRPAFARSMHARPAWHLVPLQSYRSWSGFGMGRGSLPILATRGCPFQCMFCSSPRMWTTRWIAREPDDVLDE